MDICKDSQRCTGCSACLSVCPRSAIQIVEDSHGFYRPKIDESKCVECGLCQRVCPANGLTSDDLKMNSRRILAYQADDAERAKSSSGAAFWTLATYVLNNGGVVYGACFDEDFRVVQRRCASVDDAQSCRGSKYSQGFVGSSYVEAYNDLKQGLDVLYSGTPCQIAGLRSFLSKKNYSGQLVTCDLICHGTPSNRMFREYISFLEKKSGKKVIKYFHRPKDRGWGVHVEKALLDDGTALYDTIESNTWRDVFYSNNALNSSCYNCAYTDVNRVSDFTLADFLGVDRVRKGFNDHKGLSVVMVNSELAERIVASGVFEPGVTDISLEEVLPGNPMLERSSSPQGNVDGFWKAYEHKGFEGTARFVGAYGFVKSLKTFVKRLIKRN